MIEKLDLILVPTDFSAYSCEAFAWAAFLAQKLESKILILHVISEKAAEAMVSIPGNPWERVIEQEDKSIMNQFLTCLKSDFAGTPSPEPIVVAGTAHEKIVEVAKDRKAGMIIMATHGRTGFSRALMGSVAEKVVRTAPCPVFAIRPKGVL